MHTLNLFRVSAGVAVMCLISGSSRGDEVTSEGQAAGRTESESPSALLVEAKSELSAYTDTDSVNVLTPALSGMLKDPLAGWSFSGSYLVDVISAASVDIVSTASPRWSEVRQAGALSASYKPEELGVTASGSVSSEPDYLSLSGGGSISYALAHKSVTPVLGYSYAHDASGRTGTPLSTYSLVLIRHAVNAGIELILDPFTVLTLASDVMFEVGDQEKPYRFVPLFAPAVAPQIPVGASVERVNALRLPGRVFENTPDRRNRFALSARLAQRFTGSTFVLSERLYQDDWGVDASTTDLRVLVDASKRVFVWMHLRGHVQSGASFWRRAYVATLGPDELDVPALRTGDRELGPLLTGTFGVGLRWHIGRVPRMDGWSIIYQVEGATTKFSDALFVQNRQSFFNALQLEAKF